MSNNHRTRKQVESKGASLILNGAATSQKKSLHSVMSPTKVARRDNRMDAELSCLATFASGQPPDLKVGGVQGTSLNVNEVAQWRR